MASPLPSSGVLALRGDLYSHCTDGGSTNNVALKGTIVDIVWVDYLGVYGSASDWTGSEVTIFIYATGTYRNTVDTNVTGYVSYTFYDGTVEVTEYGSAVMSTGTSSANSSAFPACFGSCYIANQGLCYSVSPTDSGDPNPQPNMDWYHGKLRKNFYTTPQP